MLTILLVLLPTADIQTDYSKAYRQAKSTQKLLLVEVGTAFDFSQVDQAALSRHLICRVPVDYILNDKRLLSYSSLDGLDGKPGIVIIRFGPTKGWVVSVLPVRHVNTQHVDALLTLPDASLTQRTLIWAIRVHPERPLSTMGRPGVRLMAHAARHSWIQANRHYQHHNLPMGIASSEIVAESWPWNKNIVDAAVDIVWSWRQSPGHWGAAKRRWSYYGYDMKTNGRKWFATGVFR